MRQKIGRTVLRPWESTYFHLVKKPGIRVAWKKAQMGDEGVKGGISFSVLPERDSL